jgi:hypothetical protein
MHLIPWSYGANKLTAVRMRVLSHLIAAEDAYPEGK